MLRTVLSSLFLISSFSCADSEETAVDPCAATAPVITNSAHRGLAFAALDEGYTSSVVCYYEFATGNITTLNQGQSGDPALFFAHDRLFLVNRETGNQNISSQDVKNRTAWTAQAALSQGNVGDPWDILALKTAPEGLVSFPYAGKLLVVNLETGATVREVTAAWDVGSGAFRPTGLLHHDGKYFVLQSGLSPQVEAIGSQTVFVLDGELNPVDQDTSKEGVQGIAHRVSNAENFIQTASGNSLIVGFCGFWHGTACKGAVDEFDPATGKVTPLYDLPSEYEYDGAVVEGPGARQFHARVQKKGGGEEAVRFDADAKSFATVHTFNSKKPFGSGIFYDSSAQVLIMGDRSDDGGGVLVIKKEGSDAVRVPMSYIAAAGAWVR